MSYLIYLRSFLSVYRQGSISKAAATLHLTQPAVSRHVKLLEDRLDRKLFERLPRGITATAAAHELERLAGNHLDALEALTHLRAEARMALSGTVFIGTTSGLSKLLLNSLSEFGRQDLRLNMQSSPPPVLLDALAENKLDLLITPARIPRKSIEYRQLYSGKLRIVCAPLWRERLPKTSAPKGIPLIEIQGRAPSLENYWQQVFGCAPETPALLVPDFQAAHDAAEAGLGIAAVPDCLCRADIQCGQLLIAHQAKNPPEIILYTAHQRGVGSERIEFAIELLTRAAAAW